MFILISSQDDHPPTIMINIPVGSAGENAAGELVVRPKSVVHLDCVFYRRLGSPSWIRTADEGNISRTNSHPTGLNLQSTFKLTPTFKWTTQLSISKFNYLT